MRFSTFHFAILLPLFFVLSSIQIVASGYAIEKIKEECKVGAYVDTLLSEFGYDPQAVNEEGRTVLHVLPYKHSLIEGEYQGPVTQKLINFGAQVNAQDKKGCTPLDYSAKKARWDMFTTLLNNGAEILETKKDKDGNSHLHFAVNSYSTPIDIISTLIEHGVDVNGRNKYGETPLHRIRGDHAAKAALLLIQNGAQVNCKNNEGTTPFMNLLRQLFLQFHQCLLNGSSIQELYLKTVYWKACSVFMNNGLDDASLQLFKTCLIDLKRDPEAIRIYNEAVAVRGQKCKVAATKIQRAFRNSKGAQEAFGALRSAEGK